MFGLASAFCPPLKLLIGRVTNSAALTVGGLAHMVLPRLIVGNEMLILGGVALAVGGWFLAHRPNCGASGLPVFGRNVGGGRPCDGSLNRAAAPPKPEKQALPWAPKGVEQQGNNPKGNAIRPEPNSGKKQFPIK